MNDEGKNEEKRKREYDSSNLDLDLDLDLDLNLALVQENEMKNKSKKLKAAIVGVLYYLQLHEEENSKPENNWVKSGREIIMQNRMMVQRRGLSR